MRCYDILSCLLLFIDPVSEWYLQFLALALWGDQPRVVLSVSVAKQLSITVKETSAYGSC